MRLVFVTLAAVTLTVLSAQKTNQEVIDLIKPTAPNVAAKEDELLAKISAAADPKYDIGAVGLRSLKASGIADTVIVSMVQKMGKPITNQVIIDLATAGVKAEEIVRLIEGTPEELAKFEATTAGLVQLRGARVDPQIRDAINQKMNPIIDPDEDLPVLEALNARMTAGVILGNGESIVTPASDAEKLSVKGSQFSEASSYLAFETQPMWALRKKQGQGSGKSDQWFGSLIGNIRLTTIGVAGAGVVGTSSAPPASGAGTSAPPSTGNGSNSSAPLTSVGSDFVASQKAVQLQFGAVIDRHFNSFTLGKSELRWAIGGIGRYMLQSVTNSDRSARIWNLEDDLYNAYTGGIRLSLFQKHSFENVSRWKPAAYVDFSTGQFQNFETPTVKVREAAEAYKQKNAQFCLDSPARCKTLPAKSDYKVTRRFRTYIEARVILKYIYLGLDVNEGSGRDDVRFIGGVTVTLDKFLKR